MAETCPHCKCDMYKPGNCSKCGVRVCSTCLTEISDRGYWDEIYYEHWHETYESPKYCKDCYEQARQEFEGRWEYEHGSDDRYYNENPYRSDKDGD